MIINAKKLQLADKETQSTSTLTYQGKQPYTPQWFLRVL